MFDKLAAVEGRYEALAAAMSSPEVQGDANEYRKQAKALAEIEPLVMAYRDYRGVQAQLKDAQDLAASGDAEMAALAADEIKGLTARQDELLGEIKILLLPKDPRDERSVIVEIRAGAGGDEAGLFAADLFRMYSRYAESRRYKVELLDESDLLADDDADEELDESDLVDA